MMKSVLIVVMVALAPALAQAQYKCVDAAGKTTFQQAACPNTQKQQALRVKAATPDQAQPPATSAALGKTADERILNRLLRERRLGELEQAVANTEAAIENRNALMADEMSAIQSRKALARNNLAGATWEQSLSTEMQAVAAKYKTMNDVDLERLKVLHADLEATRRLVTTK